MCIPVMYCNLPADEILAMMRWYARETVEEKRMLPVIPYEDVIEISFELLNFEEKEKCLITNTFGQ